MLSLDVGSQVPVSIQSVCIQNFIKQISQYRESKASLELEHRHIMSSCWERAIVQYWNYSGWQNSFQGCQVGCPQSSMETLHTEMETFHMQSMYSDAELHTCKSHLCLLGCTSVSRSSLFSGAPTSLPSPVAQHLKYMSDCTHPVLSVSLF